MEVNKKGVAIMKSLFQHILCFLQAEQGMAATEYAVMLAFIVIVSILAVGELGQGTSDALDNASTQLDRAQVSTQTPTT
jgi:Flp pilus assembly pilin Flp